MEEQIEQRLAAIEERNRRVETDKAWEMSRFRVGALLVMTYIIASIVFWLIGVKDFYTSAFIPTIGYFISVQTLPILKRWWLKRYRADR
ncbi:MAG: hypothetical protein U9Q03_00360 [Patescibacteria group bacterium]|nr:hypothetical protein [Patescibacteria group bacterium]